jgi:Raf kinase inhibitor-like YbhB/YbcL family protein
LLLCGSLLGGCGLLGRPHPLGADAPLSMSVTSPDFDSNVMPVRFTCHGSGVSPPIFWSGAPPGTKSLAVIVDDADAPISPKVYWLVFDIGPATTDLQTGAAGPAGAGGKKVEGTQLPPGARTGYNSAGTATYDPPCPDGSEHSYRLTIYALNTFFGSKLPPHPQLLQAWTAIAQHVIARGTLTAHALPAGEQQPAALSGQRASH